MSTTTLYRFFDSDGALLYVGISEKGPERWRQHRKEKPWWTEVATTTTTHYDTRADALEAERLAIIAEKPLHNVVHNRGLNSASREWVAARPSPSRQYPELDATWMPTDALHTYLDAVRAIDAYLHAWRDIESDDDPLSYIVNGAWLLEVSDCCSRCWKKPDATNRQLESHPPVAFDKEGQGVYWCRNCDNRWLSWWANDINLQRSVA